MLILFLYNCLWFFTKLLLFCNPPTAEKVFTVTDNLALGMQPTQTLTCIYHIYSIMLLIIVFFCESIISTDVFHKLVWSWNLLSRRKYLCLVSLTGLLLTFSKESRVGPASCKTTNGYWRSSASENWRN